MTEISNNTNNNGIQFNAALTDQENSTLNIDQLIDTTQTTTSKKKHHPGTSKSQKKIKPKKSILQEQQRLIELIESVEQKYIEQKYQQSLLQQKYETQQQHDTQESIHAESIQLMNELQYEQPAVIDRLNQLSQLHATIVHNDQWQQYIECYYNLPQVDIEPQLNTYCALYDELYYDTTHNLYIRPEQYVQQVLHHINVAEQLNVLLLHEYNHVRQLQCSSGRDQSLSLPYNNKLYYYWSHMNWLRTTSMKHIDLLTQSIINHVDRLEHNESRTVNYSAYTYLPSQIDGTLSTLYGISKYDIPESSPISYALWIHNSSKHGRVKRVEFTTIGIQLELPVAFQKNRTSLRVIRYNYDCISDQRYHTSIFSYHPLVQGYSNTDDNHQSQYTADQIKGSSYHFVSVGGIITVEQLLLPPPVRRAKGWIMTEHELNNTQVSVVPYPATADTDSSHITTTSNAPLRISYTLGDCIYLDEREPHYGWWDHKQHVWKQDGITLTKFDPIKRTVNITLNILKPFAIIQPRALDFPYRHWSILAHHNHQHTQISVQGSRLTVQINVIDSRAQLLSPVSPVLHQLNTQLYAPGDLLSQLSATGINVQPTVADAQYCRKPLKSTDLLHSLHTHISLITQCFDIESCVASSHLDSGTAVFRVRLNTYKKQSNDNHIHSSDELSAGPIVASTAESNDTEWIHVLASVTQLQPDPTQQQCSEGNAAASSSLIKFILCRGSTTPSDIFDTTPIDGQISHISLRRCLYTYYHTVDSTLSQSLNINIVNDQIQFIPYSNEQLLHQQTIAHTLNLLNVFTFH